MKIALAGSRSGGTPSDLPALGRTLRATLLVAVGIFWGTEVLGGAIRWAAGGHGVQVLVYLPKLVLAAVLAAFLLYAVARLRLPKGVLYVAWLCGLALAVAAVYVSVPFQIAFGLWVLLPLFAGIFLYQSALAARDKMLPWIFSLWCIVVAGVILNVVLVWPWIGANYTVAGIEVDAARRWHTAGVQFLRLGGFARASYAAAAQALVLGLWLVFSCSSRHRWLIWIVTGTAIALTTNKSAFGAYLVLTALLLSEAHRSAIVRRGLPWALVVVVVGLPAVTVLVDFPSPEQITSDLGSFLFGSFGTRLNAMWPDTIRMLAENGSWLLGRGLGGIGVPTLYLEPQLFSPGDNIAVYLYGVCGLAGVATVLIYGAALGCLGVNSWWSRFVWFCGIAVLLKGVTSNVLEDPALAMLLGVSGAHLAATQTLLHGRRRSASGRDNSEDARRDGP